MGCSSDHREPVKLLLCKAEGTSYERFVHNMVEVEVGLAGTPFFDGLAVVEGEAEMGFGVNGQTQVEQRLEVTDTSAAYSGNQNTPDENGNLHVCYLCIQGQFYAYSDAKIGIGEEIQEQIQE